MPPMFVAMNRFKVAPGSEAAFEEVWKSRDSRLREVPGFVEFHLLRGPATEEHVLYASHTIWRSREDFESPAVWKFPTARGGYWSTPAAP